MEVFFELESDELRDEVLAEARDLKGDSSWDDGFVDNSGSESGSGSGSGSESDKIEEEEICRSVKLVEMVLERRHLEKVLWEGDISKWNRQIKGKEMSEIL